MSEGSADTRGTLPLLFAIANMLVLAPRSLAQVPAHIPLHGVLSDASGKPAHGELQVVFALYAAKKGGSALYSETHDLTLDDGSFSVALGDHTPLDPALFAQHGQLFLGVKIEDDPEASPRMQLGSAPFAMVAGFAHDAASVEGLDSQALQRRVVGTCNDGEAMVEIAADGSVRCQPVATIAGPAGPKGPQGEQGADGTPGVKGDQGPVASFACPPGQAVQALHEDGATSCVSILEVAVTAGAGLENTDCVNGACSIGVAPGAIGMKQVSLPMSDEQSFWPALTAGAHVFYNSHRAPGQMNDPQYVFIPDSDGQCLVLVTGEFQPPSTLTGTPETGLPLFRVGYSVDDVQETGLGNLSVQVYPTLQNDGTFHASATAHLVVPVTGIRKYVFGCDVTVSQGSPWIGAGLWCQVSRFCQ